jgi:hypothetical protein
VFDAEPYIAMPKMRCETRVRDLPFFPELCGNVVEAKPQSREMVTMQKRMEHFVAFLWLFLWLTLYGEREGKKVTPLQAFRISKIVWSK